MENLNALTEAALKQVQEADDLASLDKVRVEYLGKKGSISAQMKTLGQLSAEERPAAGAKINQRSGAGRPQHAQGRTGEGRH